MNIQRLVRKFFETKKEERFKKVFTYIKSRVSHRVWHFYMFFLNLILHPNFYIQSRPYYDLGFGKCPHIEELNKLWNMGRPFETDNTRLYFLYMLINSIIEKHLDGAIAEVGVYKGHTAAIIQRLLPKKRLYLFDTFEGFLQNDLNVEKDIVGLDEKIGYFGDTSINIVKDKLGDTRNVILCPGQFPETITSVPDDETFCLVHFDADLYAPTKAVCEYFFPRLVDNGVMIFHDYNNKYIGVKKAVDEYFSDSFSFVIPIPDRFGSALIIKNPNHRHELAAYKEG